jgi:very-short-patch-repair endonuclease
MHSPDSPSLFSVTQLARELRKRATRSEVLLWQQLRERKLGVRFRRQHPFGRYVVDFYAACAKLVVEVDGGVHDAQRAYDEARQAEIERLYGVRFVRLSAELVERDARAAAEFVRRAL